jgi:ADP-heptose:LPS heptosyltransferase
MRRVLAMGVSHVADEHDVLRSKGIRLSLKLLGRRTARIRKGKKEMKRAIITKELEPPIKSTIQRYQDVFDKLGFPAPMVFNNFFDFIPRNFSDLKPIATEKKGKWIGIAPFSRHEGKEYPLEKMSKVIKILSEEENISIFLFFFFFDEKKILSHWTEKYSNVINLAGKLNLQRELLLISYLDVMLSMDSANMHLASLVQVPVVSIWGATHPALGFYGFGQDINNAVQIANLDCRPCSISGDLPCRREDYDCLEWITEESIVNRIHTVLDKKSVCEFHMAAESRSIII